MHCSGVSKDYKSAYLSYRLPLMKKLQQVFPKRKQEKSSSFITVGPHVGCNKLLDENIGTISNFGGEDYARSSSFFGRPLAEGVNDLFDFLKKYRPDILIFSLGTNDIIKGWGSSRMLPVYEKVFEIILKYQDYNDHREPMKTLFLNVIPLDVNRPKVVRKFRKANQRLTDMNNELQERFFMKASQTINDSGEEVKLFPLNVSLVTTYKNTKHHHHQHNQNREIYLLRVDEGFDSREMTYDAIHPNEKGQEFLADKIYPALKYLMMMKMKSEEESRQKVRKEAVVVTTQLLESGTPEQLSKENNNNHHHQDVAVTFDPSEAALPVAILVLVIVLFAIRRVMKKN